MSSIGWRGSNLEGLGIRAESSARRSCDVVIRPARPEGKKEVGSLVVRVGDAQGVGTRQRRAPASGELSLRSQRSKTRASKRNPLPLWGGV
jgi:hypothetical protein